MQNVPFQGYFIIISLLKKEKKIETLCNLLQSTKGTLTTKEAKRPNPTCYRSYLYPCCNRLFHRLIDTACYLFIM